MIILLVYNVFSLDLLLTPTPLSLLLNKYTQYLFAIKRINPTQPIPAASSLVLEFPAEYQFSRTTLPCSSQQLNLQCSIEGRSVVVRGLFPSESNATLLNVLVDEIINPGRAMVTGSFRAAIKSGSRIIDQSLGQSTVTLFSDNLYSCQAKFEPNAISTRGLMVLSITPKVALAPQRFLIQFQASRWNNQRSNQTILPSYSTCNSSASSNSFTTCRPVSDRQIILQRSSYQSSTAAITLIIADILSPPTLQLNDIIRISSFNLTGSLLPLETCDLRLNQLSPKSLNITAVSTFQNKVGSSSPLRLSIDLQSTPLFQNDTIRITFPLSIPLSRFNAIAEPTALICSQAYNQVNCLTSSPISSASITISQIVLPGSTLPSQGITVQAVRNSYVFLQNSLTVTAVENSLSVIILSTTTQINQITTLTFVITTLSSMTQSGFYTVTFPSQINVTSPLCTGQGDYINRLLSCSFAAGVLKVYSLFGAVMPAGTYKISVSGVKNPSLINPVNTFALSAFYNSDPQSLMAKAVGLSYIATRAVLDSSLISVVPSSYQVMKSQTSYTVNFVLKNSLPINSVVLLKIPSCIIADLAVITYNCAAVINNGQSNIQACTVGTVDADGSISVTFTSLFASSSQSAGARISLTINNAFTNPSSTKPCSSFSIQTFSASYPVDYINFGIGVTMTLPAVFSTSSVTHSSLVNSAPNTITFTLKQPSSLESSSFLKVTFPSQLAVSSGLTCQNSQGSSLICSVSGRVVTVQLTNTQSNSGWSVKFVGISNSISLKQTSSFQVETGFSVFTYTKQSLQGISNHLPSSFGTITSFFSPATLGQPISLRLGIASTGLIPNGGYILVTPPSSFLVGNYGCTYSGFSPTCTPSTDNPKILVIKAQSWVRTGMILTITGLTSPKYIPTQNFVITSYTADGFKIDESQSVGFTLSCSMPCKQCQSGSPASCTSCYSDTQITGFIYFANNNCYASCPLNTINLNGRCMACSPNCATCQNTVDNCTSCPTSTFLDRISSNILSTCVQTCPQFSFRDLSIVPNACTICQSNCKACTSLSNCLTPCQSGKIYRFNGTCVDSCPTNMILINNICIVSDGYVMINGLIFKCSSPCKSCYNSDRTRCSSCIQNFQLVGYQCLGLITCNIRQFRRDRSCLKCISPCQTCTNQQECLTCESNNYLTNKRCSSECPPGTFGNNKICQNCENSCKTCLNASHICTSCFSLLLFENSCYNQCPPGTFKQIHTCQKCSSNCSACLSLNNCSACSANNFLLANQCVSICPTAYGRILSGSCSLCQDGCLNCIDYKCLLCKQGLLLYEPKCIKSCPLGFIYDGVKCIQQSQQVQPNSQNQTNKETQQSGTVVPFPWSLFSVFFIALFFYSRIQYKQIWIGATILPFASLGQVGANLTLFIYRIYYNSQSIPFTQDYLLVLMLTLLVFNFTFNLLASLNQLYLFHTEQLFKSWIQQATRHRIVCSLISFISLMVSYKVQWFNFSAAFHMSQFKINLPFDKLFRLRTLTMTGVLFLNVYAVITGILFLKERQLKADQMLFVQLDMMTANLLSAFFSFFILKEPSDIWSQQSTQSIGDDVVQLQQSNNFINDINRRQHEGSIVLDESQAKLPEDNLQGDTLFLDRKQFKKLLNRRKSESRINETIDCSREQLAPAQRERLQIQQEQNLEMLLNSQNQFQVVSLESKQETSKSEVNVHDSGAVEDSTKPIQSSMPNKLSIISPKIYDQKRQQQESRSESQKLNVIVQQSQSEQVIQSYSIKQAQEKQQKGSCDNKDTTNSIHSLKKTRSSDSFKSKIIKFRKNKFGQHMSQTHSKVSGKPEQSDEQKSQTNSQVAKKFNQQSDEHRSQTHSQVSKKPPFQVQRESSHQSEEHYSQTHFKVQSKLSQQNEEQQSEEHRSQTHSQVSSKPPSQVIRKLDQQSEENTTQANSQIQNKSWQQADEQMQTPQIYSHVLSNYAQQKQKQKLRAKRHQSLLKRRSKPGMNPQNSLEQNQQKKNQISIFQLRSKK